MLDAVVVGAGPNGLAAAVALAGAGCSVRVLEGAPAPGGGTRSAELTLPGYVHDVCSAIHPLAAGSPYLASLPLADRGLEWVHPPLAAAHPLLGRPAAVLAPSVGETAAGLGRDGRAWQRLFEPLAGAWPELAEAVLGPPLRVPRHPATLARFGLRAPWPAAAQARALFRDEPARALLAGMAAHSVLDLRAPFTAAIGVLLAAAGQAVGWPFPRGGSQRLADALVGELEARGGQLATGRTVATLGDLPAARAVLFDLTPRQLVAVAGDRLAPAYRARVARFRYGPAVFKLDYALDGPVPWSDQACGRAATVHVGGTAAEVVRAEAQVAAGRHPERPFVLCAQPSLFDPTRSPAGRHTFWAYCHVPAGSTVDMTAPVEDQLERFAPGFRQRVLARRAMGPADLERANPNLVEGDISGGSHAGLQLLFRPVPAADPYRVPIEGQAAFLCSSSTPPGAGVHGMCGWWAARSALRALGRAGGR